MDILLKFQDTFTGKLIDSNLFWQCRSYDDDDDIFIISSKQVGEPDFYLWMSNNKKKNFGWFIPSNSLFDIINMIMIIRMNKNFSLGQLKIKNQFIYELVGKKIE